MQTPEDKALAYLETQQVLPLLQGGATGQLAPDFQDLARLHQLLTARKAFTVLEFGVGWSTIVIADALKRNKEYWESHTDTPALRRVNPFMVFSVDSYEEWLSTARQLLPASLQEHVSFHYAPVEIGTFQDRACHFFSELPDVVPDFIYLDGPDPDSVAGSYRGLSWKNADRTVLSGDILHIESTLLPGTFILVDGRTNNARFMEHNFQRTWSVVHDAEADVTTFELVEPPLGPSNRAMLQYCLGDYAAKGY